MSSLYKTLFCMIVCIALANAFEIDYEALPSDRCIVVSRYSYEVDCSIAFKEELIVPLEGSLTVFNTLEAALAWCKLKNPIIDIIGTVYITEYAISKRLEYYGGDIVINGVDYVDPEDETKTMKSVLVGLSNFQIQKDSISVTFNNLILDGCGTKDSIFLSTFNQDSHLNSEYRNVLASFYKGNGFHCYLGENLIIENSTIINYSGNMAVCHVNCLFGQSTIRHNNFLNIAGQAIALFGVAYDIGFNNHCCSEGYYQNCYYVNADCFAFDDFDVGEFVFLNNNNTICDENKVSSILDQLNN